MKKQVAEQVTSGQHLVNTRNGMKFLVEDINRITKKFIILNLETQEEKGVAVFIAGAGMAAALPGVVASLTTKPVIGVPLSGNTLDGMDALLSIVQMPSGMPVATVAIDGAKNAALLAVQMGALSDAVLCDQYKAYRNNMAKSIYEKDKTIQEKLKD